MFDSVARSPWAQSVAQSLGLLVLGRGDGHASAGRGAGMLKYDWYQTPSVLVSP